MYTSLKKKKKKKMVQANLVAKMQCTGATGNTLLLVFVWLFVNFWILTSMSIFRFELNYSCFLLTFLFQKFTQIYISSLFLGIVALFHTFLVFFFSLTIFRVLFMNCKPHVSCKQRFYLPDSVDWCALIKLTTHKFLLIWHIICVTQTYQPVEIGKATNVLNLRVCV